jgi:hypothetical protein
MECSAGNDLATLLFPKPTANSRALERPALPSSQEGQALAGHDRDAIAKFGRTGMMSSAFACFTPTGGN